MSRLHLVGFPHTVLGDPTYSTCAYTAKIEKFQKMGWDNLSVYHGGEPVGPGMPDWPSDEVWARFNARVSEELDDASNGDTLLLAGGISQLPILERHRGRFLVVEPGVGYTGVSVDTHHAYESTAWRHFVYGRYNWDGRAFDTVIPNYFDPADFPFLNQHKGEYILFIGRFVRRKGPHVALEIANRLEMPILMAGPGPTHWAENEIVAPEITLKGKDMMYVGEVAGRDRADLYANALCTIVPTLYVEPFGGVAVESMLAGTPVVASDWGSFTEIVDEGITGHRFSTIAEGAAAVEKVASLNNVEVRNRALERFSLEAVKPQFDHWFNRLSTLWHDGYYA